MAYRGLPQTGQCVIFGEKSENRFALSPFGEKGSVKAANAPGDPESGLFQKLCQPVGRIGFFPGKLRVSKYITGGCKQRVLMVRKPLFEGSRLCLSLHEKFLLNKLKFQYKEIIRRSS